MDGYGVVGGGVRGGGSAGTAEAISVVVDAPLAVLDCKVIARQPHGHSSQFWVAVFAFLQKDKGGVVSDHGEFAACHVDVEFLHGKN